MKALPQLTTRDALALVLDQVDYMRRACTITEAVGAALPVEVLEIARASIEAPDVHTQLRTLVVELVTHWRLTANGGPLVLAPEPLERLVKLAGFTSFCGLARVVERNINEGATL